MVPSVSIPAGNPLADRVLTWWSRKITQEQESRIREVAGPRCLEYVIVAECGIGIGFGVDPCILRQNQGRTAK